MHNFRWLVCLARKGTKECLSEVHEVYAPGIYAAADLMRELLNRPIDSDTEYFDCLCISENHDIPWYLSHS